MTTSTIQVTNEVVTTALNGGAPFDAVRVIWDGERTLARVDGDDKVLVLDQSTKTYTARHPMSLLQRSMVRDLLVDGSPDLRAGFHSIADAVQHAAGCLGVLPSEPGLEDAVRAAIPGRYEDVIADEAWFEQIRAGLEA